MTHKEGVFHKGSIVLALFPQTTCFYKGIVESPPLTAQSSYVIKFEDNTYPDGFSPPMHVHQLYVLKYKDHTSIDSAMLMSIYETD
ncbi:hypothetical protein GJ496_000316 [Pomphorhynchus laevis]|nr:hypothetical protein GJ496_000316 [Pomphorhynchus laevis]